MFFILVWFCEVLPLFHSRFFYSCVNNCFIVIVVSGADTKAKLTWRKIFGSTQTHLYFSNVQGDQRRKHNCFTEFETNFSMFSCNVTESSRPSEGHLYTFPEISY